MGVEVGLAEGRDNAEEDADGIELDDLGGGRGKERRRRSHKGEREADE